MSVRVRFAPSPTGYVHIGGLRTALYNYLFAAQQNGAYLLRIEDTDRTRLVEGAVENIIEALDWTGIHHNEGPFVDDEGNLREKGDFGPYIQSNRLEIYREYIDRLLESGHAYHCFCTKERLDNLRNDQKAMGKITKYDGLCRGISLAEARKRVADGEPHVIRLKLPVNHDIVFNDLVRGRVSVNTDDMDDQVLMKSDGFPTYHLAVIVDDHLMGITHIIRGEEWVPSTPKHVYIYEAFGWEVPQFVHLPNILNSEKKKLSKRQGDVAVGDFKKKGYLPEALVNYIAMVGWAPEDNQEIMSMEELIKKFSLDRVSKSGGVFDVDKLNWVSAHYIREADIDRLTRLCIPYLKEAGLISEKDCKERYDWIRLVVKVSRDNLSYLSQIGDEAKIFFGKEVAVENDEAMELLRMEHVPELLRVLKEKVKEAEIIDAEFGKTIFKTLKKETGVKGKNLFMPVRIALTGQMHGPEMVEIIEVLGRDTIIERIDYMLENNME
ncbi:MAG: glutamate--tRNA ligase [Peptostreptococcaceae bacterium]|nr:glutamate--tRNA ligase [Peptostreptococcaceae bacterium]